MPLSARHDDPALEMLARELYALFPACLDCDRPIARFEDAAVLVHRNRLVHRASCGPRDERAADEAAPSA